MIEFLKVLFVILVVLPAMIVLTQDLQVFPSLVPSLFSDSERDLESLPPGVESLFLKTPDGKQIEVWRLETDHSNKGTVLLFHGNGESNDSAYYAQRRFVEAGYTTYQFDYRGIGKSSGWPRESGIYLDSETVVNEIAKRESIEQNEIILVGISMGSGPASYIASQVDAGHLILLSPYTSIPDIVRGMGLYRLLTPFLWWNFPVKQYVGQLEDTSLIIAHGEIDNIIPLRHGERVAKSYQGNKNLTFLRRPGVSHNDLFHNVLSDLLAALEKNMERHTLSGSGGGFGAGAGGG